jgi:transcriptional regulator with XRE-family HTH domain
MYLGIVIKEVRKQKGLTQVDLSDLTGISVRTIQRIEKDVVEPSIYSLKVISEVLEVDFLKIKSRYSMTFISELLGINLNDDTMTAQDKVHIEERLQKIESHLLSIDRTYRKNRRTLKGVLIATAIMVFGILAYLGIWMLIRVGN